MTSEILGQGGGDRCECPLHPRARIVCRHLTEGVFVEYLAVFRNVEFELV